MLYLLSAWMLQNRMDRPMLEQQTEVRRSSKGYLLKHVICKGCCREFGDIRSLFTPEQACWTGTQFTHYVVFNPNPNPNPNPTSQRIKRCDNIFWRATEKGEVCVCACVCACACACVRRVPSPAQGVIEPWLLLLSPLGPL